MLDESSTRPSVPNSAPINIESLPPVLPSSVKATPSPHRSGDVKMCALIEDGHEVFELLSDSDAEEDLNSDLEVIAVIQLPDSTVDDDLHGDIGGGPSHDDQDFAEFPEADNFPLVESDTIWEDGGKSFVRDTGVFRPTRSVTVEECSTDTLVAVDGPRNSKTTTGRTLFPTMSTNTSLSKRSPDDPWPVLPVPPPNSPPAMALPAASEPGAIAAKLRRHRQEVGGADIPPENSKRARAPSTRKRGAQDEVISDPNQLQKKKGKRNAHNLQ
ncbi:hypothetical protein K438DRAFT_2051561 [Mycena galopus ATCC 62051]|nr:hypothetical protein K438DRAFT_2051561 [Mycena galopus ATCC 62051]